MAKKNRISQKQPVLTSHLSGEQGLWRERPWHSDRGSFFRIRIRVTPRGGRDAVDGTDILSDGSHVLKIRTSALPQDGEANDAVRKILSKSLDLPVSRIILETGTTSRIKIFKIDDPLSALDTKLHKLCVP